MQETEYKSELGGFELKRFHDFDEKSLRAWDAADEYILSDLNTNHLKEIKNPKKNIIILNDNFGALTIPLIELNKNTVSITNSLISSEAIKQNALNNNIDKNDLEITDIDNIELKKIDFLIIKIPKNIKLLEYQLFYLRNNLSDKTVIIAASMLKNLSKSSFKAFENYIGSVTTSLAKKKARLLYVKFNEKLIVDNKSFVTEYNVSWINSPLLNYPGVFSSNKIDNGTSFLLNQLRVLEGEIKIADFGCGNGIISIFSALKNEKAIITAVDETFTAVKSTKENILRNNLNNQINVLTASSLKDIKDEFDVIYSNPPFHSGSSISRSVSEEMIRDSYDKLKIGGYLEIVANSNIGYHSLMKKVFGNYRLLKQNNKYVILKASKF